MIGRQADTPNYGLVALKSIFLPLLLLFSQSSNAQTVSLTTFATGFNWLAGVERAPGDPRLYAFTKEGHVRIVNTDGTVLPTPFLDISAQANNSWNNEQGLVGLAFHPQYQQNGLFYVFYNQKNTGVCTISRFMRSAANPDQADPMSEGILLTYEHPLPNHVGGCMKFGPDGYLYIGTGDGGGGGDPEASGQNMLSFKGKILRINVGSQGDAYTIPAANPYLNAPDSIAPEIWASGLRNPWRFNFDPWTGDLWIADVGQDEREEINFQASTSLGGENYGWSCMEGTLPFNSNQCFPWNTLTGPLYEYNHDGQECSITGGTVYRGTRYADLFGKYIFTDFCAGKIWALSNDGVPTVVQLGNFNDNDFTAIEADNTGELYAVGYFTNNIYKITSDNCAPVAWLVAEPTAALPLGGTLQLNAYGNDLNYQWLKNGQPMAGANSSSLTVNAAGTYSVQVTNPVNGCSNTSNETVVTAPAPLSATIETTHVSCFGEANGTATVVATDGSQNYTYLWSIGATTASISGLPAGSYSVTVGDGNSTLVLEATIEEPATEIILELDADFDELKMWAIVSGGTPPYEYLWNTGATTDTIYNLQPNTFYELTITDANGCTTKEHFYIISETNDLQTNYAFGLSPNPVHREMKVSFHLPFPAEASIDLYDAMGRRVQAVLPRKFLKAGEQQLNVLVSALPHGVYALFLQVDGHRVGSYFVKN